MPSQAQLNTEAKTRFKANKELCSALRKTKVISNAVKAILLEGCIRQDAYIQFGRDLQFYGMYEALLYQEGYEAGNDYKDGTFCKLVEHFMTGGI
jgi:hypothetical protein